MTTQEGDMLVAAPERWDEACFVVPALRALMTSGMKVGVLCRPGQREFWQTLPGLEIVERPGRPRAAAKEISGKWRVALLWEAGWAADTAALARIPQRLGPATGKLAKRITHPLLQTANPLDHRVRFYLTALEEIGIATQQPEFFAPADSGVERVPGTVLLSPESDFGASHEWLTDRWLEIGKRVLDAGLRVTVAGMGQKRSGMAESMARQLGDNVGFFRAAPLVGALERLAAHERVIAADGSLPHLAAHVGATCITLFGPNDPQWKRPLGTRHAVVKHHVECAPCLLEKCPLDLRCQRELETERVWMAVNPAR